MKSQRYWLLSGVLFAFAFIAGSVFAMDAAPLAPNQTMGFGNNRLLIFTYEQNYDCVDQPVDDLNFNGIPAESDPGEFQTPICQAAFEPTIDPTGRKITKNTAHLYVLVPMFSLDNDQNATDAIACPPGVRSTTICGTKLGTTLINLFGALPEAFKTTPLVFTQCPDNGTRPGSCTMHSSTVDLGPALVALKKLPPPATNVFVPTPNHSHVVDNNLVNSNAIWWEVRPVLVTNPSDWPPQDGSSGITSVEKMDDAEKAGDAIEVPSNFFLFFSSHATSSMKMD
jgi:hypothetical protein